MGAPEQSVCRLQTYMLEPVSAMGDGVTHPEELLGDRVEPVLILGVLSMLIRSQTVFHGLCIKLRRKAEVGGRK